MKLSFLLLILLVITSAIFIMTGCQYSNTPVQIVSNNDFIELKWDPPSSDKFNKFGNVEYYKICYKTHTIETVWKCLDLIPAENNPSFTVYNSDIGNGAFDFAITAIYSDKRESLIHSSTDLLADPPGGWYLLWIRSE
jgi:hypothetical protein